MVVKNRKWVIVTPKTHARIMKLKYELGFKTSDDLINFLIDFYLKHSR